jgi:hypothetical protein
MGRRIPTEYFILANLQSEGSTIGHLAGTPIVETVVDASGCRYAMWALLHALPTDASTSIALAQANGSFDPGWSISWRRRQAGVKA